MLAQRGWLAVGMLLSLVGSAQGGEPDQRWQLGVASSGVVAVSDTDRGEATTGLGLVMRGVRDYGQWSIGLHADFLWMQHSQSPAVESEVSQQTLLFLVRDDLRRGERLRVGLEAACGLLRYGGHFHLEGPPGCFWCGDYDGHDVRFTLEAGPLVAVALGGGVSLELGGRFAFVYQSHTQDIHEFNPAKVSLRADLGLSKAF